MGIKHNISSPNSIMANISRANKQLQLRRMAVHGARFWVFGKTRGPSSSQIQLGYINNGTWIFEIGLIITTVSKHYQDSMDREALEVFHHKQASHYTKTTLERVLSEYRIETLSVHIVLQTFFICLVTHPFFIMTRFGHNTNHL